MKMNTKAMKKSMTIDNGSKSQQQNEELEKYNKKTFNVENHQETCIVCIIMPTIAATMNQIQAMMIYLHMTMETMICKAFM